MTDELPLWLWLPAAIALWGYLGADALARRRTRRMSAHFDRAMSDWRECRAEFDLSLYTAYEAAADATNDRILNARGRRAGIDPVSLFMGNARRAHAYASPELIEWWETHPRITFERFERQWIANRQEQFA